MSERPPKLPFPRIPTLAPEARRAPPRRSWVTYALGAASCACGSAGPEPSGLPGGGGECNVEIAASPPASAIHLTQCTDIPYTTNPPSGGDHYGVWAAFQIYSHPVPSGYLVHNLEHGAIVFWYNCPEGCADEVAEVQALVDAQPEDPLCDAFTATRRAVIVPSPDLPTRWGVSAWGYALTADCVDSERFGTFYTDHYGRAPETLCNDGQVIGVDACP